MQERKEARRNYMTKEKQRRRRFVNGDGSERKCNEKMDQMLSALDLLEMNVSLRVSHSLKDKREDLHNRVEVTEMHIQHMEDKLSHHEEKEVGSKRFKTS